MGNDLIAGNGGNDFLYGKDGHDVIIGGLGADLLAGDAGDDLLINSKATLDPDGEVDTLGGGDDNDRARAGDTGDWEALLP